MDKLEEKHWMYAGQSELPSDEYDDLSVLQTDIEKSFNEQKDNLQLSYPSLKHDFKWVLIASGSEDYHALEVSIWRTETDEEYNRRMITLDNIKKKKKEQEHLQKLKETRLKLAEDQPDYQDFLKLKEKYKDII